MSMISKFRNFDFRNFEGSVETWLRVHPFMVGQFGFLPSAVLIILQLKQVMGSRWATVPDRHRATDVESKERKRCSICSGMLTLADNVYYVRNNIAFQPIRMYAVGQKEQ